jgi:general secretion pathway protein D
MLQLKKIYVNEDNNALVIRDTPETIEVAEKILEANDVPDAEVLLEVEIIELSKKNQEKFGLALSRYAVSAIFDHKNTFLSDSLTATGTTGDGSVTVPVPPANLLPFDLGSAHGFATVPNATFNFGKTLANGETLSNPKLRVKNREKAKFNVGTRQPITTTTTNGTATGYSVNVQYVDVGVKMNAEPVIQLNNEISMKLSLEVSSIIQKETVGGATSATTVVTIGTRNLDTVLSLKDGETTIIGGLIQDTKSKSKNKIMFLSDIPILGTLLTDSDDTNEKSELILAITPRLIKGITLPDAGTERFWSGRDDEPSTSAPYVSFAEEPQFEPPPAAIPAKTSPAPAAKQSPEAAAVKPPPVTPAPPAVPSLPEAPPQGEATSASMTASLLWGLPGKVSTGDQFALSIVVDGVQGLHAVPLIIKFDPKLVEFVTARQGQFLGQDGHQVSFQAVPDIAAGTLSLTMSRPAGVAGVNGDGELVSIVFRARAKGLAQFDYRRAALADPAGRLFGVTSSDAWVEIE